MPTRGRSEWAQRAMNCFLLQTYEPRELVVVDDADDLSFPNGIDHPLVRYVVNQQRLGIPHKRNQCTRLAHGQIIVNFDSDDWSAPTRMETQVARLINSGKALDGFHSMLFYNEADSTAWKYRGRNCACGTSMCMWKSYAETHPFNERKKAHPVSGHIIGTDNDIGREASLAGQLSCVDGEQFLVARIHDGQSSKEKRLGQPASNYSSVALDLIPKEFFECVPAS